MTKDSRTEIAVVDFVAWPWLFGRIATAGAVVPAEIAGAVGPAHRKVHQSAAAEAVAVGWIVLDQRGLLLRASVQYSIRKALQFVVAGVVAVVWIALNRTSLHPQAFARCLIRIVHLIAGAVESGLL
jgi:hypothetical protein